MNRSAAFQKGVQVHGQAQGRVKAGGRRSSSGDDDTPTPQETAAMLEGFGVSQYPPGESFRAQLNQSTPHPLPGSAQTMTTRGPVIPVDSNTLAQMRDTRPPGPTIDPVSGTSYAAELAAMRPHPDQYAVQSGRMSADQARQPNWAGVNAQRQALQEAIAGGAISSGLGIAPGPNDANTLATMAGMSEARTARFRAGAAAQNAIPNDANTLATMRDTVPPPGNYGDPGVMGPPPRPTSTTTEMEYDEFGNVVPDSGGTVVGPNADAAVAVNPSTGLTDDPRQEPDPGTFFSNIGNMVTGAISGAGDALEDMFSPMATGHSTPATTHEVTSHVHTGRFFESAASFMSEASGATALANVVAHPLSSAESFGNTAWDFGAAVANPTRFWRSGKVLIPALARYYRDHPEAIVKLGVGAAVGLGVAEGANVAISGVTNAVKAGAATGRAIETAGGVAEAAEVGSTAARVGTELAEAAAPAVDDVGRVATVAAEATEAAPAASRTAAAAEGASEGVAAAEDIATQATKVPLRYRAAQTAERGIDFTDRQLSRYIGMREDLRNYTRNIPRKILGMEERDLRLGWIDRQKEALARHISGEGESTSAVRQNVSQHVSPVRRDMPELPEGTSQRAINRSENLWRRQAREDVLPGNPVSALHKVEAAADFIENPMGWLEDKLGFDESQGAVKAADEATQAAGVRFSPKSSRAKSTAKRRMPELSQPEPSDRIPTVNRPDTDEPMYEAAENPMIHRTTTYNDPNDWYDKKMDDMGWAPGEEPNASAPRTTRGADELVPPPGGGGPPAGGGAPPGGGPPATGGGSGNRQTAPYTMGRGFGGNTQRGPRKSKGFWEGRPEFTGASTNYDRLTIRPITVPRGPIGGTKMDLALAAGAGAAVRAWRNRGGAEQNGGAVEEEEGPKDPFGDPYNTPQSREEGQAPSPEAQAKIDREAAWEPAF